MEDLHFLPYLRRGLIRHAAVADPLTGAIGPAQAHLELTVAAQLAVRVHGHFAVDGWFAFSAIYGFLACVGMVLFAKLLGLVLKRRDTYYEDDDDHV